jgi:hypothetical protein
MNKNRVTIETTKNQGSRLAHQKKLLTGRFPKEFPSFKSIDAYSCNILSVHNGNLGMDIPR